MTRNSADSADGAHGQGAFFGRRKGHKLRAHQSDLVLSLLPRLAIDTGAPPPQLLSSLFCPAVDNVRLEIGFGGGEHLLAEALASPTTGFIGCEPYVNGMAKILAQIERADLQNIRLFAGDALDLLRWMPPRALTRVDLIHPDPWPKRRHWKRRFVQDGTLSQLARVLVAGGEFRFVSDIDSYCAWTLAHVLRKPEWAWTAERADDWRQPWPGFTMTRYGRKAAREARKSAYLRFQAA
jgi:tRNA (guanine-N7-)-methyltransferase